MRNAFCSYLDYHALSVNNCVRPEETNEFALNVFESKGVQEFKKTVQVRRFSKDVIAEMNRFIDKLNEDYWNVLDGELIPRIA